MYVCWYAMCELHGRVHDSQDDGYDDGDDGRHDDRTYVIMITATASLIVAATIEAGGYNDDEGTRRVASYKWRATWQTATRTTCYWCYYVVRTYHVIRMYVVRTT